MLEASYVMWVLADHNNIYREFIPIELHAYGLLIFASLHYTLASVSGDTKYTFC